METRSTTDDGPKRLRVAMIIIGDEIMDGFLQDENAAWMAAQAREHGAWLDHVEIVRDSVLAIDAAVRRQLGTPRPRLVITSGGIGSTPDDVTYEAVASALGRELVRHPQLERRMAAAVDWVADHGWNPDDHYVESMMKMADVPDGAEPLTVEDWGVGARIDLDGGARRQTGVTITVLPGVPSQFRAIVEKVVAPDLMAGMGSPLSVEEITHDYPESVLNRLFADLRGQLPDLDVGSYPGHPAVVRLYGPPGDVQAGAQVVRRELARLDRMEGTQELRRAWRAHAEQWHLAPDADDGA